MVQLRIILPEAPKLLFIYTQIPQHFKQMSTCRISSNSQLRISVQINIFAHTCHLGHAHVLAYLLIVAHLYCIFDAHLLTFDATILAATHTRLNIFSHLKIKMRKRDRFFHSLMQKRCHTHIYTVFNI